jgi:hypothetical protein
MSSYIHPNWIDDSKGRSGRAVESFSFKRKIDANPPFFQVLPRIAAIPPVMKSRPKAPCSIAKQL